MSVFITLQPERVRFADYVAKRRRDAAVAHHRQQRDGAPTDSESAWWRDQVGARCECAAYTWLEPVKWHAIDGWVDENLPDLHDFIDVKGVDKERYRLIVQSKGHDDWAYLHVLSHDHPTYEIRGWAWGYEAMRVWNWKDPKGGRPAYFVDDEDLRDPAELLAILRDRQTPKFHSPHCACWECSGKLQSWIVESQRERIDFSKQGQQRERPLSGIGEGKDVR